MGPDMAAAAPLRLTTERRNRGTRACAGQAELPWSVGPACGPGHHRASTIAHTGTPHTSAPVSYPGTRARAGHSARSARRIKRDRHSRRIGRDGLVCQRTFSLVALRHSGPGLGVAEWVADRAGGRQRPVFGRGRECWVRGAGANCRPGIAAANYPGSSCSDCAYWESGPVRYRWITGEISSLTSSGDRSASAPTRHT